MYVQKSALLKVVYNKVVSQRIIAKSHTHECTTQFKKENISSSQQTLCPVGTSILLSEVVIKWILKSQLHFASS